MNKNKNRFFKFITIFLLTLFNFNISSAFKIVVVDENLNSNITWEDTFNYYWDLLSEQIPESYKYINLKYTWLDKDSDIYNSLQMLVYYDLLNNINTKISPSKDLSAYAFYRIAEKIFDIQIINEQNISVLKKRNAIKKDFTIIDTLLTKENEENSNIELLNDNNDNSNIQLKKEIFNDVYKVILNDYYGKDEILEEDIINSAIEWLVDWAEDKHTVYFPPIESKSFYDSLNWEYEWIGSYVELAEPWVVKIVSPIKDSPSEKAWLKWWDIILKVDGVKITEKNSLEEVVSWIKWPAWTNVILTIQRWEDKFDIEVTRAKIIINDVEYEKLNYKTFYIEITSFWENVSENFEKALEQLKKETKIKKLIIDLRNNWWGYLWQVSDMLWYFIPQWENTAVVKYLNDEQIYKSKWYNLINFNDYEIILLQNSGTASASEIMIWTIKDYFPEAIIIWEQSYWKWSVQTVKSYSDGSSLKYTVAKWFTWKTLTWIDWIWITPDIEVEFNSDLYKEEDKDNQLEEAINY